MHYVYVLESSVDKKQYVGCTANLEKRIQEHNAGLNASTQARRPLKLIYYEAFLLKEDAFAREKILKGQWGRKFLQRVLKHYFQNK